MEKPLSIARKEFNANLANIINNSNLPLCIVYDILQNVTIQIGDLAGQQLKEDELAWQKELEKQKEGEVNNEVQ